MVIGVQLPFYCTTTHHGTKIRNSLCNINTFVLYFNGFTGIQNGGSRKSETDYSLLIPVQPMSDQAFNLKGIAKRYRLAANNEFSLRRQWVKIYKSKARVTCLTQYYLTAVLQ